VTIEARLRDQHADLSLSHRNHLTTEGTEVHSGYDRNALSPVFLCAVPAFQEIKEF
jgi:hypothetical protein